MAAKTQKDYVLFVHGRCPGSKEALQLLNESGMEHAFEVQNVATVPAKMLPTYVTGVPTVVDLRERTVHKGSGCIEFVRQRVGDSIPSYSTGGVCPVGGNSAHYGSFEDGSKKLGGHGFASVDVTQQLAGPSVEEEATAGMDVTKYQQLRDRLLPSRGR